jgi:hypothetical protein
MSDTVRVQTDNKNPWWTRWYEKTYAKTPGGRAQEAMRPGSVPGSPVGQTEPERFGISALGSNIASIPRGGQKQILNAAEALGRFFTSQQQVPFGSGEGLGSRAYATGQTPGVPTDNSAFEAAVLSAYNNRPQGQFEEEPASRTLADMLAGHQFDSSPYDNYMNFLMQQDEETMARINAMYSQLADSAQGNMQRVADVYDSARIQSGDVFGGSAQNIEDAYSSASQQAADQMARLGIEAAAPSVLDPMALSQAEAVSGIERAGAGALDALTRYGASAQDFGGQMAQVGQQQGLEVSSQILRDMQQRQAEAAFMRSQAQADFNPYQRAMQEMQAQQMFDQMNAGQDPMELVEQMRIAQDRALTLQDRFIKLAQSYADQDIKTTGKINTKPGETPEERARMMLDLVGSDDFGYPMPMF